MATHRIYLSATQSDADANVGNSMSTTYDWLATSRQLWVKWKGRVSERLTVPEGVEYALVRCDGGAPEVTLLTPPRDPLRRVAWEWAFYASKRVNTREEVMTAYEDTRHHASCQTLVAGEGFAFYYRPCMAGQVGKPTLWWAAPKVARPDAVRHALRMATDIDYYNANQKGEAA